MRAAALTSRATAFACGLAVLTGQGMAAWMRAAAPAARTRPGPPAGAPPPPAPAPGAPQAAGSELIHILVGLVLAPG